MRIKTVIKSSIFVDFEASGAPSVELRSHNRKYYWKRVSQQHSISYQTITSSLAFHLTAKTTNKFSLLKLLSFQDWDLFTVRSEQRKKKGLKEFFNWCWCLKWFPGRGRKRSARLWENLNIKEFFSSFVGCSVFSIWNEILGQLSGDLGKHLSPSGSVRSTLSASFLNCEQMKMNSHKSWVNLNI